MQAYRILASILAVSLPTAAAMAVSGTPTWFESRIASVPGGFYVSSPALAFDHYGTPSVAWSQVESIPGVNTVRHSQFTGLGLWNTRDIASGSQSGLLTSIAFDRSERPAISWVNSNGSVEASFNGGAPQSFGTDAATGSPCIDLSYDLAGNLSGMYARSTVANLYDIRHTAGVFSGSNMTTLGGVTALHDAAMIVDGRGLRQLAARATLSGGSQAIVLSSEPQFGGAWPTANLITATNVTGVDIAMDPSDGRAALAYTTYDSGTNTSRLFYSKFSGFSMVTTQILSSTGHRYEDVSLAFDHSDGLPAIGYERKVTASSAEELWFAYTDNGISWLSSLVDGTIKMDAPGGKPRRPSLAFDDYGTSWPAVAYIDGDGGLQVAFDPPAPEPASLLLVAVCLIGRRRHKPIQTVN